MKMCILRLAFVSVFIVLSISGFNTADARVTTGLRIDYQSESPNTDSNHIREKSTIDEKKINQLINLKDHVVVSGPNTGRAIWTETAVEIENSSGQGLLDLIVGEDGNLYCAYYDDEDAEPNHNSVYLKKSTDGGETWVNPDSGPNGFSLAYLNAYALERVSLVVYERTAGSYRLIVTVSAPLYGSPSDAFNIFAAYKDLNGSDFSSSVVQSDSGDNYLMSRIAAVDYPSASSGKRIVCASYSVSDGRLWCDMSDYDGAVWNNYTTINPATDQVEVWRADFIEDQINGRLFCTWAAAFNSNPDHPRVILALSEDEGSTWFADLYAISPSGYDYCAEPEGDIATNPLIMDQTIFVAWTGRELSSDLYDIHYTYQDLNSITSAGGTWNVGTMVHGTLYSDTDYNNTLPAVMADNRYSGGGYRVAFLDQHQSALAQIRYCESGFSTPFSWTSPEIVSGSTADPARQGSTALSIGVGYNATTNPERRCVTWPDFRDGTSPNIYASYGDSDNATTTPTAILTITPTQTPTSTSDVTNTPTPAMTETPSMPTSTHTPAEVPTTGSIGFGVMILLFGLAMIFRKN